MNVIDAKRKNSNVKNEFLLRCECGCTILSFSIPAAEAYENYICIHPYCSNCSADTLITQWDAVQLLEMLYGSDVNRAVAIKDCNGKGNKRYILVTKGINCLIISLYKNKRDILKNAKNPKRHKPIYDVSVGSEEIEPFREELNKIISEKFKIYGSEF